MYYGHHCYGCGWDIDLSHAAPEILECPCGEGWLVRQGTQRAMIPRARALPIFLWGLVLGLATGFYLWWFK